MATLVSYASGNLTDASATWKLAETGSGALVTTVNNENGVPTSYIWSDAFTVTNNSIIEGVCVFLIRNNNNNNTITLGLSDDGGSTAAREVTINNADLGAYSISSGESGSWVFFKFGSTITGDGGSDYKVGLKSTSTSSVLYGYTTTTGNMGRVLRTSVTATAAAGDMLFIVADWTAATTVSAYTVTMDSTATTDYGAIEIGNNGTLSYGTSATTNYILKLSGNLNVRNLGTLNIGTVATPIPRNSTAALIFDCTTNVEFGLIVGNYGTFVAQGLSRTSGKNIVSCLLNTDEAVNSTSLGVDTDTGWLDNDEIVVAATSRTATQCEKGTLNGDAGASTLTVDGFGGAGGGLAYAHSGTSPIQAEIINLTRNVVIRGASASNQSYVLIHTYYTTVNWDWVEFYWMGSSTSNKEGIKALCGLTSSLNIQYCSIHDFVVSNSYGIFVTGAVNYVYSYNVSYNISNAHFYDYTSSTSGTSVFTYNIGIYTVLNAYIFNLATSLLAPVSYCTVVGGGAGIQCAQPQSDAGFNSFSYIVAHSNVNAGLSLSSSLHDATFSNCSFWRNGVEGIRIQGANISFSSCSVFGNTTANINVTSGSANLVTFTDCTFSGDSSFSSSTGLSSNGYGFEGYFINCTFGVTSGIKTAHTSSDIGIASYLSNSLNRIYLINCILASTTEVSNNQAMGVLKSTDFASVIGSQKHDQTAGNHKSWKRFGVISIDTTANMYRTSSPSERLTPNNASYKLVSSIKKVAIASGTSLTPSVYVRESVAGDGTDYNGARVRLIVKRNDAVGITSDTVLATATAGSEGAFQQLTAATATATDTGVLEFYVDCDGTTGWINIDDWSVS